MDNLWIGWLTNEEITMYGAVSMRANGWMAYRPVSGSGHMSLPDKTRWPTPDAATHVEHILKRGEMNEVVIAASVKSAYPSKKNPDAIKLHQLRYVLTGKKTNRTKRWNTAMSYSFRRLVKGEKELRLTTEPAMLCDIKLSNLTCLTPKKPKRWRRK